MTKGSRVDKPSPYDLSDQEVARLAELAVEAKSKAYCMLHTTFPVSSNVLLLLHLLVQAEGLAPNAHVVELMTEVKSGCVLS